MHVQLPPLVQPSLIYNFISLECHLNPSFYFIKQFIIQHWYRSLLFLTITVKYFYFRPFCHYSKLNMLKINKRSNLINSDRNIRPGNYDHERSRLAFWIFQPKKLFQAKKVISHPELEKMQNWLNIHINFDQLESNILGRI